MNWKKVLYKFIFGSINGGIATLSTTQDIDTSGKVALVVGVLSAALNFFKHRKEL